MACPPRRGGEEALPSKNRVIFLALLYPELAADSLLNKKLHGRLPRVISSIIDFLDIKSGSELINDPMLQNVCKTFIEIITYKPLTLKDLNDIPGLGPIKINRYGQDILEIIQLNKWKM